MSTPIATLVPGFNVGFDSSRAVRGTPGRPHKMLLIGHLLASGAKRALEPVLIMSTSQGEAAFGRGSQLASMIMAAKAANPSTTLWAIGVEPPSAGVAMTRTLTVTGPATAAGTLDFLIADNPVAVGVAKGATPTEIAASIVAAATARTDLPVTATAEAGVVTLTARWKGITGNDIPFTHSYYPGQSFPAGVGIDLEMTVVGTGAPDFANVIMAIGEVQYDTIATAFSDAASLSALEEELATRWGPETPIDGHAFAAVTDTHANLVTFAEARNSPHLSVMPVSRSSPTPSWVWAAVTAAVDAAEPDPARPRQTLPLRGILPPPPSARFTRSERQLLLESGISTWTVDAGEQVCIERLVTTYTKNALGVPDPSYRDLTTIRTLSYLRWSTRTRFALRFPRHKLAGDDLAFGPGQPVVTPSIARAELLQLAREWEAAALVEDWKVFRDFLVVDRNPNDPNRLDAWLPPDLVNQFRLFDATIQFLI